MDDRLKYQFEGMKWLKEMELVEHPQFINTLKFNCFSVSKSIKDVEFLVSNHQKAVLIWLDVSWFGRTFKSKQIKLDVYDQLKQLLPSYKLRVITDYTIMEKSIEKLEELREFKKSLQGETDEKYNPDTNDVPTDDIDGKAKSELQEKSNTVSNSEEQSVSKGLPETIKSDS